MFSQLWHAPPTLPCCAMRTATASTPRPCSSSTNHVRALWQARARRPALNALAVQICPLTTRRLFTSTRCPCWPSRRSTCRPPSCTSPSSTCCGTKARGAPLQRSLRGDTLSNRQGIRASASKERSGDGDCGNSALSAAPPHTRARAQEFPGAPHAGPGMFGVVRARQPPRGSVHGETPAVLPRAREPRRRVDPRLDGTDAAVPRRRRQGVSWTVRGQQAL